MDKVMQKCPRTRKCVQFLIIICEFHQIRYKQATMENQIVQNTFIGKCGKNTISKFNVSMSFKQKRNFYKCIDRLSIA